MPNGTDFAAGFLGGLSDVMAGKRQERIRRQEREQDLRMASLKHLIETGALEPGDVEFALGHIFQGDPGQKPKKPKQGQIDPQEVVRNVLTTALSNKQAGAAAGAPQQGAVDPGPLAAKPTAVGAPQTSGPITPETHPLPVVPFNTPAPTATPADTPKALPVSAFGSGATPAPAAAPAKPTFTQNTSTEGALAGPRTDHTGGSFLGVPLLSQDEIADQKVAQANRAKGSVLRAATEALIANGMSKEDAPYVAAGVSPPSARRSQTGRYGGTLKGDQVGPGEKDAYGRPIDPNSFYRTQIQPDGTMDYLPTVAPGASSAGIDYNRAAISMGFRSAAEVPPERRAELETKARQVTEDLRYSGGIGTGNAAIDTASKKVLTPDEAAGMQATYGITQGQAADLGRVALTGPQREAATASFQLDNDVVKAKDLFEKVWPKDPNPLTRRAKLIALTANQDPDYIELQSLLKRMSLRLAVMTQGSRPSDTDQEIFKSSFPTVSATDWNLTVPSSYESGARLLESAVNLAKTSRESIGIVPIADRNVRPPQPGPQNAPVTPGAPAAQAAPAAGEFSTVINGKVYTFDTQAKLDLFKRNAGVQ